MNVEKFNKQDVINSLNESDREVTDLIITSMDSYLASQLSKMNQCLIPYIGNIVYNHKRDMFFRDREEIIEKKNTLSDADFKSYLYDRAIRVNNDIKNINKANRSRKVKIPKNTVFKYVK